MNRRNFIKTGTLLLSIPALAKLSGFGSSKLFAMGTNVKDFSIEIITDKSDKAISLFETLIKQNFTSNGIIKYSEYEMTGSQNSDIVYFNDGKLINYKTGGDKISQKIKSISNDLNCPDIVENPRKIRFYTQSNISSATKFLVIHNGTVIEEIKPAISFRSINIKGTQGNLSVICKDNKLSVTDSSCRHKTCVKSGSISRAGEYLVCIPNEIVIMAE